MKFCSDVEYKDQKDKMLLEEQYFFDSKTKGELISSKIDRLVAIYTSKFKWAWGAQFLSHTLLLKLVK